VLNLAVLAARRGLARDLEQAMRAVIVVAVGEVTAETLAGAGFTASVVPTRPRLGAMVHAFATHCAELPTVSVGPVGMRLGAAAALVDGTVVDLPRRELRVLAELADRPGVVVAKSELRRRVWSDGPEVDDHAVEVTVGRLRRRLPARLEVQTVARRGYRLVAADGAR
jgi:uroporphyrinogen-III synthase